MGKVRLQVLLGHEGVALSVSSVGRILNRALARGAIRPVAYCEGRATPKRPQCNGCVERANRSARIEFWNLYEDPLTVRHIARPLLDYEFFYNYQRPHAALDYRTPNEYLVQLEVA